MVGTSSVKYIPISDKISVSILNGGLDLGELVQKHSALLSPLTGKEGIYLGVFYDLKQDPKDFDPTKANIRNGRHNLLLTVHHGNIFGFQLNLWEICVVYNGLLVKATKATDAAYERIEAFLRERAQLELESEGVTRPYVNAIFYQAE